MENYKKPINHLLSIGLLGCAVLAASCGQKGPLYLPETQADKQQEQEKQTDTEKKSN